MASLLLIFILFQQPTDSVRPVEREDLSTRTLVAAATDHGKTLLAVTSNNTVIEHYLVDHAQDRYYQVVDGRINASIIPRYAATPNGFAVVDMISLLVYQLDRNGNFRAREDIQTYEGYGLEHRPVEIMPYKNNEMLLTTYIETEEALQAHVIDLEAKTCRSIHRREADSESLAAYWVWDGDRTYFVYPEMGRIDLLERNRDRVAKILSTGKTKVRNPFYRPRVGYSPHQSRFLALIQNPLYLNGRTLLDFPSFNERGLVRERQLHALGDGALTQANGPILVGKTRERALYFDRESGEFLLQRVQ